MNAVTTYQQTRWSLADLFPSAEASEMQQAFSSLEQKVAQFEAIRPALTETISAADFMQFVRQLEDINIDGGKLYGFANLLFTEDTQNQSAQSLLTRVQQFFAELSNRTLFFSLWWKDMPDAPAEQLMASSGDYRYWLEEMRHFKPHTLTEAEEKIINIKDVTGAAALSLLYELDHQPLHLQGAGGWGNQRIDPRRTDGVCPRREPRPARGGLPGTVPRVRQRWTHPGADLPGDGTRLAQRAGGPAQVCHPDLGPQPGQRHPRCSGGPAAGDLPEK